MYLIKCKCPQHINSYFVFFFGTLNKYALNIYFWQTKSGVAFLIGGGNYIILCRSGEDRWLCTLLLQRGYRVEYSAASDAYTHCPEGFNEFFNQRRRWVPSTMANIFDLLADSKHTIRVNDNISMLYICYQVCCNC